VAGSPILEFLRAGEGEEQVDSEDNPADQANDVLDAHPCSGVRERYGPCVGGASRRICDASLILGRKLPWAVVREFSI
jgi:hypothetical protein